jgi:tRNA-dihydrouridine synthase B
LTDILGLRHPLVLSPMVDVTDPAFRSLAREHGADVTCSEMVAAAGLAHGHAGARGLLARWPGESPYGVQLMCGDPEEMRRAVASMAESVLPDFLDVNLGCPAPNILRSCAGGFLMRDPGQAERVLRAAREAADEAGIRHLSAKMRLGPDANRLTYLEVGRRAEAAGCSWVTLHARTVAQGYAGSADWSHIGQLVRGLGIPVVGNGDLRTPADVVRMREATGCAGFFVARAAMADPTVFRRMRQALDGRPVDPPPAPDERRALLHEYLRRAQGLGMGVAELRRQASRLTAGLPGAKAVRVALQQAQDVGAVLAAAA